MAPHTPGARTRCGGAVARLGVAPGCFIVLRGAPRWPPTPPALGRAAAEPWRASGSPQDVSSFYVGPRHGPPHPPTLGPAAAEPWRASGSPPDVSSARRGEGCREADGGVDGRAAGLAPLRAQSGARQRAAHTRREPAIAHHA